MKVLITSGGTKIPIDTVRDITNMSSGTFGTKIATEFLRKNHEVVFVRAKGSKSPVRLTVDLMDGYSPGLFTTWFNERMQWMRRYSECVYKTFEQYERTLQFAIAGEKPDVVILAAAVSDYYVPNPHKGKIRSNDLLTLKLESLPKIISKVKGLWAPNVKLVGFKLMVDSNPRSLLAAAQRTCVENGCDMVVANDLDDIKHNQHKLTLVFPKCQEIVYENDLKDPDFLAKMIVKHVENL